MATQVSAVVCAWCNRIVFKAPAGAGVSHTICPSCFDWTMTHPESQTGPGATSDLTAFELPRGDFGGRLG
jgi:hypothetical protein